MTPATGAIHNVNQAFRYVYKGHNKLDVEAFYPKSGTWKIYKADQDVTDEQLATIIGWEA